MIHNDTVYESSPNPLRRFSTFISSVRGSRSEETGSTGRANSIARQTSTDSSYKLLHKLTGKTKAKSGSSIIRRDGSVILVKNGKIVSMKVDTKLRKSDNDDVFISSPSTAGSTCSKLVCSSPSGLEVLHERDTDTNNKDSRPLFPNGPSHNADDKHLFPNGNSNMCNSLSDNSDCESPVFGKNRGDMPSPSSESGKTLVHKDVDIHITGSHISEINKNDKKSPNSNYETKSATEKKKFSILAWTKGHVKQKSDTNLCKDRPSGVGDKSYAKSSDAIYSVPLLKTPSAEEVTTDPLAIRRSSSASFLSPDSCVSCMDKSSEHHC